MPTYQETLDYLFAKLPMFTRIGAAAYKKDLTNTLAICEALDNPHHQFKCIHIAGTNGKGSTSHMLAAILQAAGYKTGLYTSPHLHDFRERIKVNGNMCDTNFVIDFTEQMKPLIEEIEPSFFEITVGMAFTYFKQQAVDIAVIETGLGGRLDSTNVITPILSVITNIGYDHMNLLGNTLPEIASEKAGIIKPTIPVVIGETNNETKPVFIAKASVENAPIYFAKEKRYVADVQSDAHTLNVTIAHHNNDAQEHYVLDVTGRYQANNLVTVLEAVHQLRLQGFNLNDTTIHKALQQIKVTTGLHGRWEVLQQHPLVIVDVAHNEDGIKQVAQQLEITNYKHLHIIIGMAKDKAIDNALELLPKNATYYFTKAQIPRALPPEDLQQLAKTHGLHGNYYMHVNEALQAAAHQASKEDVLLVCGSVFVVAEVALNTIHWN